ncbi:AAEL005031-PA [Aedes aegypti]|nr:AAEL005031-PA [Aedes aegypti]
MEEEDQVDLLQCRLCLTDEAEELISLYSQCLSQDKLVVEVLTAVMRLDSFKDNDDNMPQHICGHCLSCLDAVYSFVELARRNGPLEDGGECCRICRRDEVEELISILCVSSKDGKLIADMLQDVCGLPRPEQDDDGHARYVCRECFNTLSAAYSFRAMGLESNSTLSKSFTSELVHGSDSMETSLKIEQDEMEGTGVEQTLNQVANENEDPFIYLDSVAVDVERLKPLLFTKENAEYYDQLIFNGIICCCRQLFQNNDEWQQHCRREHSIETILPSVGNDCTICHRSFSTASQLAEHLKKRENDFFYRCKICNIMTQERDTLVNHFEHTRFHPILHESAIAQLDFEKKAETDYESSGDCCGCSEQFETGEALLQHVQEAHYPEMEDHPTFQCLICYQSFPNKQSLKEHQLVYATTKTYRCRTTNCEFKCVGSISDIKEHVESGEHLIKSTEFFCCFYGCYETFETSHALEQHCLNDHTEQRITNGRFSAEATSNVCWLCNRHIATKHAFKEHIRAQSDRKHICSTCGKKFVSQKAVVKHERVVHSTVDPSAFPCDRCPATFSKKHILEQHIKTIHNKIRSELCTTCGKGFATKRGLKGHIMNRHMEERPYKCTECTMTFGNKFLLQKHLPTHSNERPHKCSYCGITYRHLSDVKRHINAVHLDNKPYACESCDARFVRLRDLQVHAIRHTKTKRFRCNVVDCDFATNVRKQMDKHSNENHNDGDEK